MPSKIDYEKTPVQFYQFICKNEGVLNTYVGGTVSWRARKGVHKFNCNNVNSPAYNLKVYQIIRANGGWSNWDMIEIHKQLCSDKRDSERVEQSLMNKLSSDMNTKKAHQTAEELRSYHQQYGQQYQPQYRADNRELINSNKKVKHSCCCGGRYTLTNKSTHLKSPKHRKHYPLDICSEINI